MQRFRVELVSRTCYICESLEAAARLWIARITTGSFTTAPGGCVSTCGVQPNALVAWYGRSRCLRFGEWDPNRGHGSRRRHGRMERPGGIVEYVRAASRGTPKGLALVVSDARRVCRTSRRFGSAFVSGKYNRGGGLTRSSMYAKPPPQGLSCQVHWGKCSANNVSSTRAPIAG